MDCRKLVVPATLGVLLWLACPVYAHAILLSATPGPHQVIKGPDITINLRFNARIDVKRSSLRLLLPDGKERLLSPNSTAAPDCLKAQAAGLTGGSYVLRWQVLAGDGHLTRGEVPFTVQ